MSPNPSRITHVSDTALMTAACRAIETGRPDGLMQDPFAARLAGERGMAIAHALTDLQMMCFGVGMRGRLLDELVLSTVPANRIATVLSVGAGLDTRPWRLNLPTDLLWIEVDLPAMLEYKAAILESDKPSCRVERLAVDVNDPARRRAMFAAASEPALMITEGLLAYLPAATVEALASDAAGARCMRYWLLDLATSDMARSVRMQSFQDVEAVRAPDSLAGEQIVEVLNRAGWVSLDRRTYVTHATRLIPPARLEAIARASAAAGANQVPAPPQTDLSGVHLFGRS